MIILTINKEDYTLGGLITEALKRDDRVVFAACKVCHPHECRVDVYMATLGGVDGRKVLKDTVLGLVRMTEKFRMKVTHEFELYKMVQLGKEEAARAVAQTQEGRPKEQSGQEKQGENEKEEEEEQTGETGAEAEGEAERETDLFAQELDI